MKKGVLSNLRTQISQTGQHLSGLRSDLRSRLGGFRHYRSASEQQTLTEDFSRVLAAWGIDDLAAIPGVVRALRLRFLVFAAPVIVCIVSVT